MVERTTGVHLRRNEAGEELVFLEQNSINLHFPCASVAATCCTARLRKETRGIERECAMVRWTKAQIPRGWVHIA
jgi:hypothetical protein